MSKLEFRGCGNAGCKPCEMKRETVAYIYVNAEELLELKAAGSGGYSVVLGRMADRIEKMLVRCRADIKR